MPDPAKIADVIPTFYYDLIARVAPGSATVLALLVVRRVSPHPVDGAAVLLLSGIGYVVGVLLTSFTTAGVWLITKRALQGYSDSSLWYRIHRVASTDREAGTISAKMAAETTLCENLALGSAIAAAVAMAYCIYASAVVLAAVAVAALLSAGLRRYMLSQRLAIFESLFALIPRSGSSE